MKPDKSIKSRIIIFIAAFIYLIFLIAFEAAQQQYYITSFILAGNGTVSFIELLQNHIIRWAIWSILALPLGFYVYNYPLKNLNTTSIIKYGSLALSTLLVTLLTISLFQLWLDNENLNTYWEYLSFFFYQKSALFLNAYLGLIVLIHLFQNIRLLDSKIIELSDLKIEYNTLHSELNQSSRDDTMPIIQIKMGNKIKNISLSEVVWIQSDDYCVRIHTAYSTYNLRKSMKLMEKELSRRGFIRIHRNSIVNKEAIDILNFSQEPHVKLKNGLILPMASSRIPSIKENLKTNQGLTA